MTFLILFGDAVVSIYVDIDDPSREQIIHIGALLLIAAALFQFVDGGQAMALGLLRGIQDTAVPMIITILSYFIYKQSLEWQSLIGLILIIVGVTIVNIYK